MIVHKFKCDSDHMFFIALDLPVKLTVFAEMGENMTCPICQSKNVYIYADELVVQSK